MQPYAIDFSSEPEIDLVGDVKAGFPSPAEDVKEKLDLLKLLVRHPASTFYFRISGVSMVDASLDEGDIVVVDRSLTLTNNCVAVCFIDGEFTVKRVHVEKGADAQGDKVQLLPANPKYKPLDITPDNEFIVWGIVTYVIKKV